MEENSQPRRRWFRFRLRSLLLITLVVALAAYGYQIPQRKRYCEARAAAHKIMVEEYQIFPEWQKIGPVTKNSAGMSPLEFHQHWYAYYQQAAQRPWWPVTAESDWPQRHLTRVKMSEFEIIPAEQWSQMKVYQGIIYTPEMIHRREVRSEMVAKYGKKYSE